MNQLKQFFAQKKANIKSTILKGTKRLKQFYNQEKAYIELIICIAIALFLTYVGLGEKNNLMMYYGGGYEGMQMIWVPELNLTAIQTYEILWCSVALAPWIMILGFCLWR